MANYNLTNQAIEDSFEPLLQIDSGSFLRDGTGSLIDNINVTASFALTASYALNAVASASQNWNDITNKPSGLVSGSSQIDLAQTFGTASHAISASYAVSASYEIIKEVSSSYADTVPFDGILNKPTLVSGSSQVVLEDTTFTDNGEFSFLQTDGAGNLSFQYVESINDIVYAGENISKTDPLYVSGSQGANPIVYKADAADPNKAAIYIAAENITQGSTGRGILLGGIDAVDLTGIPAGTTVYLGEGGGWSITRPSGSNSVVQTLGIVTKTGPGGKGEILNPGPAILPNLQSGYAWVGDGGNQPQAVATSSFAVSIDTGSLVTTSSFNAYTQSTDNRLNNIELTSASLISSISDINGDINTLTSQTASYAKKNESNTFIQNQNIQGLLQIIGTSSIDGLVVRGPNSSQITTTTNNDGSIIFQDYLNAGTVFFSTNADNFNFSAKQGGATGSFNFEANNITFNPDNKNIFLAPIEGNNKVEGQTFVNPQTITSNVTIEADKNALLLGPVNISGEITIEGDSELYIHTPPTFIDTGSFTTTASFNAYTASNDNILATFATTGSNTFQGTQIIRDTLIMTASIGPNKRTLSVTGGLTDGTTTFGSSMSIINLAPPNLNHNLSFGVTDKMDSFTGIQQNRVGFFYGETGLQTSSPFQQFYIDIADSGSFNIENADLLVSQSLNVKEIINLAPQDPLPSGQLGDIGVSGSALYFYDGSSWRTVNLT
jgi:hypothetical protein